MPPRSTNKDDRIFVRDGRRLYRRSFSTMEPLVGIAVVVVLIAVLSWVAWKGAHPDPNLFMLETDLAQAGEAGAAGAAVAPDRGPLPEQLVTPGWVEGDISQFDSDNLYEKINGRESFYKSFGFEMLYYTTVTNEENEQMVIDIELYDLGNSANAMGAYSGERSPEATPEAGESGLMHVHRNALMMTQGRFYLRALGSEESSAVRVQLEHIRDRFAAELPREPLPWGYALLAGRLGMNPAEISYIRENAFSFGFARNVYSATLDDGETELFVSPAEDEPTAAELAARYREGFLRYGTAEGDFIKDRYVGTYAFTMSAGPWVVGFRRAEDPDETRQTLTRLAEIVSDFPMPEPASPVEPDTPESVEDSYESYE